MKCPNCGQEIIDNKEFCIKCGKRLKKESKDIKPRTAIIIISVLLVFGIGICFSIMYLGTDKELKPYLKGKDKAIDDNDETENNELKKNSYKIEIIDKINNISNIYAFDTAFNANYSKEESYDIIARYKDESKGIIATIIGSLDYRMLDFDNNKLYFVIAGIDDVGDNSTRELYYIDLNNLKAGEKEVIGFNNIYNKSSNICVSLGCSTYPTKIFVDNDLIYYTELNSGSSSLLKTYNIKTGKVNQISNKNIGWTDFHLDKVNNKLFYLSDNELYISDLDGKNEMKIENIYSGSFFFTGMIYNNSPIFAGNGENVGCSVEKCWYDIYTFDYENNEFIRLFKSVDLEKFAIKDNSVVYYPKDNNFINEYYISK